MIYANIYQPTTDTKSSPPSIGSSVQSNMVAEREGLLTQIRNLHKDKRYLQREIDRVNERLRIVEGNIMEGD